MPFTLLRRFHAALILTIIRKAYSIVVLLTVAISPLASKEIMILSWQSTDHNSISKLTFFPVFCR